MVVVGPLSKVRHRVLRASPGEPSFAGQHAAARRLDGLVRQFGSVDPVWSINDKTAAYAWADRLGISRPQLVGEYPDPHDVDWDTLPGRVVLKPVRGSGGRGVHLLVRQEAQWRDLARGRSVRPRAVVETLSALADLGQVSHAVLAEELVLDARRPDAAPADWKVYTFFGQVGLVLAGAFPEGASSRSSRPAKRWRVFDPEWNDLGDVYPGHPRDPGLEPPVHAAELLDVARRVSAAVPRPFLRVDLYDGRDGVVFGEITPIPGGEQLFHRHVDRRLGALWEEAEARLRVQLVQSGALTPEAAPLPGAAGPPTAEAAR